MDELVVRMHMAEIVRPARRNASALVTTAQTTEGPGPRARPTTPAAPGRDDRGEGVISAAIAVLIMAFLGVGVWLGFRATLDDTQDKVDTQVEEIGR